jgi:hypothetical protein
MADQETDDDNSPRECDCCGFPIGDGGSEYKNLDRHIQKGRDSFADYFYCNLCASTYVSNMSRYPNIYGTDSIILGQAMCFIGNTILAKLAERDTKGSTADGQ